MRIPACQYDRLTAGQPVTIRTLRPPPATKPGQHIRIRPHGLGRRRLENTGSTAATITHHTTTTLGDITHAEIRAGGWRARAHWATQWVRDHDPGWDAACRGQRTDGNGPIDPHHIPTTDEIIHRFNTHWAHRTCHIITLHHHPIDEPRLLALRSEEIYVTTPHRALPNEPEAITTTDHNHLHRPRRRDRRHTPRHTKQAAPNRAV